MTCDIHPTCQFKEKNITWWRDGGTPNDDRCYAFFAQLANQRNSFCLSLPPLAICRGFPDGYEENEESPTLMGDHSASWCSLPEMQEYFENELLLPDARTQWEEWVRYGEFIANYHKVPFDHIRFVFNFDS